MILVAVPALNELPAARLVVASSISVVFLVIQNEYKPYATAEHNQLAALAGAQITGTLLFILMQSVMTIPRVFGFLCIVLNIILLPLVVCFNARRLKRREDILNAFLVEHEVEEKMIGARKRGVGLKRQATGLAEFFDPSHFSEYWKAGQRSEYEVFCATLDWIDTALERPVSHGTWAQILFTLEQLPLTCTANADVRHGTSAFACAPPAACTEVRPRHLTAPLRRAGLLLDTQNVSTTQMKQLELAFGFAQGERWFGFIVCDEQEHSERVRSGTFDGELVLVSKRPLPKHKVRVNSEIQEITLFDNRGGTETIPYTVRAFF